MIMLLLAGGTGLGQSQKPPQKASESQLKAAVLYNFAKFVEWPSKSLPAPNSPFVVGIMGEDSFRGDLDQTVEGKDASGHPFVVKRLKNISEARECHILFISPSERRRVGEIIEAIGDAPVLTVSEMEHFLQSGGMVNFLMEGNKVRFEINDGPARRAGLRISSKLLNLARARDRSPK
jgi:hypothetical protein